MSSEMDNFIGLSSVLTGFSKDILAPELDPINIKSQYLPFFKNKIAQESGDASLVGRVFAMYQLLEQQNMPSQAIAQALLREQNGEAFVLACRKLIFMWYSGAWPQLIPASGSTPASTVSDLISAESYSAGLVWQVMQSHAMGDSNYRYGYWAKLPAPLSDYTGNEEVKDEHANV